MGNKTFRHWPEVQRNQAEVDRCKALITEMTTCSHCFGPESRLEMEVGLEVIDDTNGEQEEVRLTLMPCSAHAYRLIEVIGGEVALRRFEKNIREHREEHAG